MSTGQDFITSDWPCFDLKDSDFSPLLGQEIGESQEVIAYLPLNPRLSVILYPHDYATNIGSQSMSEAHVILCVDAMVRNQNTLVIQQADRFIVAVDRKDFVFKVSKKRKKSNKY
jgi:hypothetical protein